MDSFQRSPFSSNQVSPTPKIRLEQPEETKTEQTNPGGTSILKSFNDDADKKIARKRMIKIAMWIFGAFLIALFFFSVGFYAKASWKKTPTPEQTQALPDIGETLFAKFGTEEKVSAGMVKFQFWFDLNDNGKQEQWEKGQDGVGINVRRKGETLPFISLETDGEGVIMLSGLDKGDYEVAYYLSPYNNEYGPTADQHFFGQKYYQIFESSNGVTGLFPTTFKELKVSPEGTTVTMGLREYKPKKLVGIQNRQLVLYDPAENIRFTGSNIWDDASFPKKFEIRDNKLFYVKSGALYKYDPFVSYNGYSEKVYDQVTAPDDSYYVISPQGTAIVYGGHDGAFFQTPDSACGRQLVRYDNKPIELYSVSYPYDPIAARFLNETHAVIYGKATGEDWRIYTLSCDGSTLTVKKLPIVTAWTFAGGYISYDRLIIKGPVSQEKTCSGSEPCEVSVFSDGIYIYDLPTDKLEKLGDTEFEKMNISNLAYDGKYMWLTNYETGAVKILDFNNKENTKILNVDLKGYFKNSDPKRINDTNVAYVGDGSFMFVDAFTECGKQKDCATVKKFTVNGENLDNMTDVITIQDMYPQRLVGELTK